MVNVIRVVLKVLDNGKQNIGPYKNGSKILWSMVYDDKQCLLA